MHGSKPIIYSKKTRSRAVLNGACVVVLVLFFYNQNDAFRNPIFGSSSSSLVLNWNWGLDFRGRTNGAGFIHRRMAVEGLNEIPIINKTAGTAAGGLVKDRGNEVLVESNVCAELYDHSTFQTRCAYLREHSECSSGGYFNYIKLFYCDFEKHKFWGYLAFGVWLVVLFYLLGNTAADYFCCSLEKLADILQLSPAVAGVSLLPLGNGAPDVFSSIAAFSSTGSGDVGLSGVLGGAVFVTCIVVGVISFSAAKKKVQIDRRCFVRDVCFFLFTLLSLSMIMLVGRVNIWGALAFVSIYLTYAAWVAFHEFLKGRGPNKFNVVAPLLPVVGSSLSRNEEDESVYESLLNSRERDGDCRHLGVASKVPQWVWASNVIIYSDYVKVGMEDDDGSQALWGWSDEQTRIELSSSFSCTKLLSLLAIPLTIPRRLTIPVIEEGRWSKGFAVASASFAPLLLAVLWNAKMEDAGALGSEVAYVVGTATGSILGFLAFMSTKTEHPPRDNKFLLPWVFGGFFMSIIWFYVMANELVALLVSVGTILEIKPSLLALTVLAWGNSIGDLVSNTALSMHGGGNGVQIAMSGCYAGPMFNVLVGLGISMLLGAWSKRPESYIIPGDGSLYCTIGFLMTGLIWALIVLPHSDMRPNRILGVGLITIYLIFLSFRVATAMGIFSLDGGGS